MVHQVGLHVCYSTTWTATFCHQCTQETSFCLLVAQVYDFALPLLILHAFTFKTMDNLKNWLKICPRRQITVLDTHDGMGIDDIAGLAEVALPAHQCSHQALVHVLEACSSDFI